MSYETAARGTLEFRVSVWEKQCQGNLRKAFLGWWVGSLSALGLLILNLFYNLDILAKFNEQSEKEKKVQ